MYLQTNSPCQLLGGGQQTLISQMGESRSLSWGGCKKKPLGNCEPMKGLVAEDIAYHTSFYLGQTVRWMHYTCEFSMGQLSATTESQGNAFFVVGFFLVSSLCAEMKLKCCYLADIHIFRCNSCVGNEYPTHPCSGKSCPFKPKRVLFSGSDFVCFFSPCNHYRCISIKVPYCMCAK